MPENLPAIGLHKLKERQSIPITMPKTIQNTDDNRKSSRQNNQHNFRQNPITQPENQDWRQSNGRNRLHHDHHGVDQIIEPAHAVHEYS